MSQPARGVSPPEQEDPWDKREREFAAAREQRGPLTGIEAGVVAQFNAELNHSGSANVGSRREDAGTVLANVELEFPRWNTRLYQIEPLMGAAPGQVIKPGGWGLRIWRP